MMGNQLAPQVDVSSRDMADLLLVSIGLPTYNRAASLGRAIESALNQDYQNIELLISDNASTDETEAICLDAARRDNRVRYLRQQSNQGATANFREVLKQSGGEFFMWLADDDWLDALYVSTCVEFLMSNPDHMLACGTTKYFDSEKFVFAEAGTDLSRNSRTKRLIAYYNQVSLNGALYGLMRREPLRDITLQETLGADWLFVSDVAFTGKVKTISRVAINRSLEGASRDVSALAAHFGVSGFMVRYPHLKIALNASKNILWWSPAYAALSLPARLFLASRVFSIICRRFIFERWYGRLVSRIIESHPRFKRAAKLVKSKLAIRS
jgi:glycosyltransferase involved in cell wall biosynthesis